MLPKGYVVIPNNDIIGETEAGTVEKCAMACINTERCISVNSSQILALVKIVF